MAVEFAFNRNKFRELILFIAEQSLDDPKFGATKLNKILYFCDFKAFAMFGEPITGATYQRLDNGPAPREILPMLRELEDTREILRVEQKYFNHTQKRVVPEAGIHADMGEFSEAEKQLVMNVIGELRHLSASEVSALSHLEAGWQLARDREQIPYTSAYISDRQPNAREMAAWARANPDDALTERAL